MRALADRLDDVCRALEQGWVRVLLSLVILISVLPVPAIERAWALFFALFALELVVRTAGHLARRTASRGDVVVLLFDLVGTLAFLPLEFLGAPARLLRLARLAKLVAYGYPVLSELAMLTWRPERRRQLLFVIASVLTLSTVAAVLLTHLEVGVDLDGDHRVAAAERGFLARLWWAFLQIESADNILREPGPTLAFALSCLLTIAGFFVFSFFIGMGSTLVGELVELGQIARTGLKQHVVILNPSADCRLLLVELFSYYRKQRQRPRVALLGSAAQVPDFVRGRELAGLRYRPGSSALGEHLDRVDAGTARRIFALRNKKDGIGDAQVISTVLAVREMNPEATILAELRKREDADALLIAGGRRAFAVLTGELQGMVMAATVAAPPMRPLLAELLSSRGQEIYTAVYGERALLRVEAPPASALPGFASLSEEARARHGVQLLGGLTEPEGGGGSWSVELGGLGGRERLVGLIGISDRFAPLGALAADVAAIAGRERGPLAAPSAAASAADAGGLPVRLRERPRPCPKLLLCGLQEVSLVVLEQLALRALGVGQGPLHATLLLDGGEERERASSRIEERFSHPGAALRLDRQGAGAGSGVIGLLARDGAGASHEGAAAARIELVLGDWTRSAELARHLPAHDVVVAASDLDALDPDARTATALLKVATLLADLPAAPAGPAARLHVIAALADAHRARLLEARFDGRRRGEERERVRADVLSLEQSRSELLAQALMVPGSGAVLAAILGAGRARIRRLEPEPAGVGGEVRFDQLSRALFARGQGVAIAVETGGRKGIEVLVNPRPGEPGFAVPWAIVRAVYVAGAREG